MKRLFDANVLEDLNTHKTKVLKEHASDPGIQDLKLLLAQNASEDLMIVRNIGLDNSIARAEELKGHAITLEHFEEQYGDIFSEAMVKQLATNYRLRLLPTSRFRGAIVSDIVQSIKDFGKLANLDFTTKHEQENFFILAPASMFDLENHPVPVRQPRNIDPLLFYKFYDKNTKTTMYRLIRKWGNDFTIMRLAHAWKYKSMRNYVAYTFGRNLFVAALLITLFTSPATEPFFRTLFITLGIVASFLVTMIMCYWDDDSAKVTERNLSINNWNSTFK